ncbi:MAG: nucleotidyl transferase AbiEii/AbiGii toxin family protein [Desulfobacteraceae bacterium]
MIEGLNVSFYLTGGTALSRCYLNHRYSDDLDFFVNANPDFRRETQAVIDKLKQKNDWKVDIGLVSDSFVRLAIESNGVYLKVDFVNDIQYHKGDFQNNSVFKKVDNWSNILSNKLCALSRMDAKDVVDILFIASKYEFFWDEIFEDAKEKDLWVEPVEISKIIKTFPEDQLASIKWTSRVDIKALTDKIRTLHKDIFLVRKNSLKDRTPG